MRVEHEGGTAAWLAGTLAAPSVQRHGLPLPQELWPHQSLFPASYSWQPEGLFGQSFSIALPIRALRGLPCLESFSVVLCIRHIEGLYWLGSYSVDQPIRHLKVTLAGVLLCSSVPQVFDGPASLFSCPAGIWGEGGYGDGSTHYAQLSRYALLPWLPGFPLQAFPTTVSSLTSA